MTQIEFENQMRELRVQKGAALTAIARLQGEVKDDMEAIDCQIHELKERKAKLNQQREDRVPDHIDAMFQERYGYHFNRD